MRILLITLHHPQFALERYICDILYKCDSVCALMVNVAPHVSSPSVRVFSCGALISQETTLSQLVIQIMAETECQYVPLYWNDPFLLFVFVYLLLTYLLQGAESLLRS